MLGRSLASATLAVLLVSLAACDDGGGGDGGAGDGGAGGAGGDGTGEATSSAGPGPATGPAGVTTGGGPTPTPEEICAGACACDPECVAAQEIHVPDCIARLADDASAAALASCSPIYDAYLACFGNTWSCAAPGACDEVAETLATCIGTLCGEANALCGCPDCGSECRSADERCWAACVVEAGSCDESYSACADRCWH